jgi:hypothetical protein
MCAITLVVSTTTAVIGCLSIESQTANLMHRNPSEAAHRPNPDMSLPEHQTGIV